MSYDEEAVVESTRRGATKLWSGKSKNNQPGVTINICCSGESMTPTRQAQRRARISQTDELSQLAWKYLRVAPEDLGGG